MRDFLRKHIRSYNGGDYAPTALEKASFAGIFLLIVLTFTATNIQSIALISSKWLSSSILPAVLVERTNDNRTEKHLDPLVRNPVLDKAAKLKAEDMAAKSYFAHESPEGFSPWHWFKEAGYAYAYAGENLAVHFTDSDAVVDAWMASPSHRENILGGRYTEIGIGTARGSYKGAPTIFVVQMFGTPLSHDGAALAASVDTLAERKQAKIAAKLQEVEVPVATTTEEVMGAADEEDGDAMNDTADEVSAPEAPVEPVTGEESVAIVFPSEVATISPLISKGILDPSFSTPTSSTATEPAAMAMLKRAAVAPESILSAVYAFLALMILGMLVVSFARAWREHHPFQVAYAAVLVLLMCGALYLHGAVAGGVLIM